MQSYAWKTLAELTTSRHSARAFLDRPLSPGTVESLVEVAGRAPSWCNAQPWHVTLVEGADALRLGTALHRLAQSTAAGVSDIPFPAAYEGVYRERRNATAGALYSAVGVAREDLAGRRRQISENHRFFGAQHVLVVSAPRALGTYGVLDCGSFITLLLLAAEAAGVGAIAQAAPALYSDELHRMLAIPADRDVVAVVSLGHTDGAHPANHFRVDRAETESLITRAHLLTAHDEGNG